MPCPRALTRDGLSGLQHLTAHFSSLEIVERESLSAQPPAVISVEFSACYVPVLGAKISCHVVPVPTPRPCRRSTRQFLDDRGVTPDRSNRLREFSRALRIHEKASVADELREMTYARANEWDAKVEGLQHRHTPSLKSAWVDDAGGAAVGRLNLGVLYVSKPPDLSVNSELSRESSQPLGLRSLTSREHERHLEAAFAEHRYRSKQSRVILMCPRLRGIEGEARR